MQLLSYLDLNFWPRMQADREARWRIDPESYLIPGWVAFPFVIRSAIMDS